MKRAEYVMLGLTFLAMVCLPAQSAQAQEPAALDTVTAEDGSAWERVTEPGFGSAHNSCIVSLCPYKGDLYALTRNEATGFEIWRTQAGAWEKVSAPGFTDGTLHELMNSAYGKLIEFDGRLYAGVSSGYEGAFLYRSVGCEIWRFDGTAWEPVVSNSVDADEPGTISAIAGCAADDGATTAEITDAAKTWAADQWKGGVLRITSGGGRGRVFLIAGNTATTLTVQSNEAANSEVDGAETEYTVCQAYAPDPDYPAVTVGALAPGDSFEIGMGEDENGFGQIWNKTIVDMAELGGELYLAVGHNYEDGTRIWKTGDGLTWEPSSDYSFGLFHGYDYDGSPTGVCLVDGYEDSVGNPVSSSVTHFIKSAVGGAETLYAGATGTTGCNGRGARMVRLDADGWHYIVDGFVDANDTGSNENGFGDAASFLTGNFQAWSFADYDGMLLAGVARLTGGRILASATGGDEDGAWRYLVGGDAAGMPDGFDGVSGLIGFGANIGPNLYAYDDGLYAGTLMVQNSKPVPGLSPVFDGADIWRATGPADALVWSRVTADGFGDQAVHNFESFCIFGGRLYVAASNLFSANPGQIVSDDAAGAVIYRLEEVPRTADIASFAAQPARFRMTLTWTAAAEPDCRGYNVWRSVSEKKNAPYRKMNRDLIAAGGSGGAYSFTNYFLWPNRTYYYKVECVGAAGSTFVGPLAVKTNRLLGLPK